MNQITYAFIITSLAGFATILGSFFIFFKKENNILIKSLSFAAGVMVTVSLIDLIPEGTLLIRENNNLIPTILISLIAITIGIIISMCFDKYLPNKVGEDNKLYRIGIISMLAIMLHNVPEGIATFIATTVDLKLGISLAISIALHNIPEGISISIPIYYASGSKVKAFLYTLISGTSELIGALLAYFFLFNKINNTFMGILLTIIAGLMLHISVYELLPTALKEKRVKSVSIFFMFGTIIMIITHLL